MAQDRSAPLLLVKLRTTRREEFRVVSDQILSFQYTDAERKTDSCKLTVDNSDLSHFDDPVWRKGSTLIVQWGYPGRMSPAREVVVTSVKGFKVLTIEANARSVLMNRQVKCRTFLNKTVSQIATDIAAENGYTGENAIIDPTDEVYDTIAQARLTDAQFLRRWASRVGFEFFVDWDGFHFHERRMGSQPIRTFRYHIDQGGGDILGEPTIDNDVTARPGRVRVRGRNPMDRSDTDATADNVTDTERETLAPITDLVDGDTGQVTQGGMSRMPEGTLASEDVVPTADPDNATATRRARGRFRRAQQVAVKMSLPIIGDPLITAKSVCKVEGMGQRLSIRYYITEVVHDFGTGGYTCKLKLVSDGHGGHSTESRRARGLNAFGVARGTTSSRRPNDQAIQGLQNALRAAQARGDEESARSIQSALTAYQSRGSAGSAAAVRALNTVTQNDSVDPSIRQATQALSSALSQEAEEPESRGRQNEQEAPEDDDALAPVSFVDGETGAEISTFDNQSRIRDL